MKARHSQEVVVPTKSHGILRTHVGIAEQGKLFALDGDFDSALVYFRKAIEIALQSEESEVFMRHYVECLLESLELSGDLNPVLEYCNSVLLSLEERRQNGFQVKSEQWSEILQKKGIILLKMGRREDGLECLKKAVELMGNLGREWPLSQALLFMARSGLSLDHSRILAEQKRLNYFVVRAENVDRRIAILLPR
jgi:tetratricopeptide (TPR) repeat protein